MAMAMGYPLQHCPSSSNFSSFGRYAATSKVACSLKASALSSSSRLVGGFPKLSVRPLPSPFLATSNSKKSAPALVCKLKTHKASAKRFTVTGNGKIVRRKAGKQHLLVKKNAKRRNRLSKKTFVDKSDYDNVIRALPYLKVAR